MDNETKTQKKSTVNTLITAVTSIACELPKTHDRPALQGILEKLSLQPISKGNIFCALVDTINHKILQQYDLNFPAEYKHRIGRVISDDEFYHGLNDSNFIGRFSLAGYNTISYGLSCIAEKTMGIFSFSKPFTNTVGSRHYVVALAPYLHTALKNIHYMEKSKAKDNVRLSKREVEILHWVSKGKTNSEIGIILGVSSFTVKNHISNIYPKLQVVNRGQAIGKAIDLGILS